MKSPTFAERLQQKLEASLHPISLEINDDSAKHAGHAGHNDAGETHFSVTIISNAFEGRSRIERHRMVYGVVADELKERVHALALKTLTQREADQMV